MPKRGKGEGKNVRKSDFKLICFDKSRRHFIYSVTNPETERVIYVGRTIDLVRRGAEHNRKTSACKQLREALRLASWKLSDPGVLQVVPELPFGVPGDKAQDFEAYFICEYDTLYHPVRNVHGCNLKHGDNVTDVDFEALKQELEEGIHSKPPKDEKESALSLMKAIANEAVLSDMVEEVGEMDAELSTALTQATMTRMQLERMCKAPLYLAVELAESYECRSPYDEVDKEEFQRDVNQLRDKLASEADVDEAMLSALRAVSLFGKSTGANPWEMRANVAASAFRMMVGAIQAQEEAKLDQSNNVTKRMLDVRKWSVENGGKKPAAHAGRRKQKMVGTATVETKDAEEEEEERSNMVESLKKESSLGKFLDNWKTSTKFEGCKRPRLENCNVVMLNVTWWKDYSSFESRSDKSNEILIQANRSLLQGFAYPNEINNTDDEYKVRNGPLKPLPCGGTATSSMTSKIYKKVQHILDGNCNENEIQRMLTSLPKERFDFYYNRWSQNRQSCLEKMKQRSQARIKHSHESGAVKPKSRTKKQKVENVSNDPSSSSSSKSVPTHEDSDSDEDSDEDSEDDE